MPTDDTPRPPPLPNSALTRRFMRCPKCGHAPLPADQSLPAACPACGLILAKFGATVERRLVQDDSDDTAENEPSKRERLIALLTHVPDRVDSVTFWSRVALLAAFTIWGVRLIAMDYRTGEINASFLHRPLLIFHEAGHVVFIPLGEFMTILGGTLGQLIMPAILCGALLVKNRDAFGAAIGLWLFGVSLLDIAPYIYDALQPQLMLLGGHTGEDGPHDWIYLLRELGMMKRAHSLGWLTHKLGALVIFISLGWAAWQLRQQYAVMKRMES